MSKFLEYIRQNIDQPLTRQHIAGHLFLSPDYVNLSLKIVPDIRVQN